MRRRPSGSSEASDIWIVRFQVRPRTLSIVAQIAGVLFPAHTGSSTPARLRATLDLSMLDGLSDTTV